MARGDRGERIVRDDADREAFVVRLAEAVACAAWEMLAKARGTGEVVLHGPPFARAR